MSINLVERENFFGSRNNNTNSLLPNTASSDTHQHVNSANIGDVDDL
jgi:hypothetical protein